MLRESNDELNNLINIRNYKQNYYYEDENNLYIKITQYVYRFQEKKQNS